MYNVYLLHFSPDPTTNLDTADSNCHDLFDHLEEVLQFLFFFRQIPSDWLNKLL